MAHIIGQTHLEAVKTSLERASVSERPEDCLPGLMRAALIGQTAAVTTFLNRGLDVNVTDPNGRTPLMEAVFGGHADTVRELLQRGADPNVQDRDGWTALMEAGAKGCAEVVRVLLAHGANAGIRNKNGWTALKTTARCNIEVTRLLREAGAH